MTLTVQSNSPCLQSRARAIDRRVPARNAQTRTQARGYEGQLDAIRLTRAPHVASHRGALRPGGFRSTPRMRRKFANATNMRPNVRDATPAPARSSALSRQRYGTLSRLRRVETWSGRYRRLAHVHCNNSSHEFMTSYSEDNNSSHELLLRDDACLMWHDAIRVTPLKCGCCEAASSWRGAALEAGSHPWPTPRARGGHGNANHAASN